VFSFIAVVFQLCFSALYPRALLTQERLTFEMTKFAELTKGSLYASKGTKSFYRIKEKKAYQIPLDRHGNEIHRKDFNIWDFSRAMISYNLLGQIIEAFTKLTMEEEAKWMIIKARSRFENIPSGQWMDLMVHIVFVDDEETMENRMISEIQLALIPLTQARKERGGHHAYSDYRSAIELERLVNWMRHSSL